MVIFVIIDKYCYNDVFFINDIISEDKQFLSYQEFQNIYDKYKLSRILWYCGCSPEGMEKTYFRVWEAT